MNLDKEIQKLNLDRGAIQPVMNNLICYTLTKSFNWNKIKENISLNESKIVEKYLLIFIEEQSKDVVSKKYFIESTANNWGSDFEVSLAFTKDLINAKGGGISNEPIKGFGDQYRYLLPI